MPGPIRVLIVTDSPLLPTGLAETTRLIFGGILELFRTDYEIRQVALCHCFAVTTAAWQLIPTVHRVSPDGQLQLAKQDLLGQSTTPELINSFFPHIVFAFNDVTRIRHFCVPRQHRSYKLIAHVNIDGAPIPREYCEHLVHADRIVTSTRYSLRVLLDAMPELATAAADWMYSPADVSRFRPIGSDERLELRRAELPDWMLPDSFILGWIGRNQWRKQIWIMFEVLKFIRTGNYCICRNCGRVFIDVHAAGRDSGPTRPVSIDINHRATCCSCELARAEPILNIFLWLHMTRDDPASEWPVSRLEEQYGLRCGVDIHYTEGHAQFRALSPADMPTLYNLWDCLLYLSGGEGFGLPAWEAMASGLPVVYSNYSSHAEFLGEANAGLAVGGILQPESGSCILRFIASVENAIGCVRRLYYDRKLAASLGRNGRDYACKHSVDYCARRWDALFRATLAQEESR